MKSNNICLIALIAVIFACAIVKLVYPFETWPTLVSGITWAAFLIAIADTISMESSEERTYLQYCKETLLDIAEIENNIQVYKQSLNIQQQNNICNEIDTGLSRVKNGTIKREKKIKTRKSIGTALVFVAFVALFCILLFPQVAKLVVNYQDFVTVIAFGLILTAQVIRNRFLEDRKEIELETLKSRELLDEINKTIITKIPLV